MCESLEAIPNGMMPTHILACLLFCRYRYDLTLTYYWMSVSGFYATVTPPGCICPLHLFFKNKTCQSLIRQ